MKRIVHYKQGYRIIICDKFYEVISGNRVLYFDELRHRPTVQEVWNKTIGLQEEENARHRQRFKAIQTNTVCRV